MQKNPGEFLGRAHAEIPKGTSEEISENALREISGGTFAKVSPPRDTLGQIPVKALQ